VRSQWAGPVGRDPTRSRGAVHPRFGGGRAHGVLDQHDDARGPRVLPVRPHRWPDPGRPRRLRAAAESALRRVPDPGPGPARADPLPPGRPDHHGSPRRPGLPVGHQRAAGLGGGRGPNRGLRGDHAGPPGPAPGGQGRQARDHAFDCPRPPRPGGLPRRADHRSADPAANIGQADRPPRRLPDGRKGREGRGHSSAYQSALAAPCGDHQRARRRSPAPRCPDPRPACRPPNH